MRTGAYAANVDESKKADQHGEDDGPGQRIFGMRKELAEINHEQVGVGSGRGYLAEPEHPCGLDSHEATEGDAGVEVRTAGLLKARSDFGEAGDDDAHSDARREHGVRAVVADEGGHGGGQSEDAAADDGVHHQRHQAPTADGADQMVAGRVWRRFH